MKNRIYLLLIIASALALGGCNEFLDKVPDNRTDIDSPEKVAELVASAYPKACYAALLNSRVDFVSDKGTGSEHNSNGDSFFWRDVNATSQDTPDWIWQKYYYSIATVNHAIAESEKIKEKDQMKPYLAEAKVIRAFSHFLIVCLFSEFYEYNGANNNPGIPYVTEPEDVVVKKYDRSTVAKTYELIEQDLLEGLNDLGNDNVYKQPKYHFTIAAANAFASRFYLYKGEWDKVIEYSSRVFPKPAEFINEQYGDLYDHMNVLLEQDILLSRNVAATDKANAYASTNFQPWMKDTYASASGSDVIKMYSSSTENPSNLLLTEMASRLSRYANIWRYGCSKDDTDATVSASNVTTGVWAYRVYSSSNTHYYVPKFYEVFVYYSPTATTGTVYTIFPYFRNEELLLNRAEAYAMLGMYDEAIDDLNVFCHQRIYASSNDKTYNEVNFVISKPKLINFYAEAVSDLDHYMNEYNPYGARDWDVLKKCIIQCILDFRRNEFMWEGLRYWDMWRYKIPIEHSTYDRVSNQLLPGDDRWLIELPESATLSDIPLNPRDNLLTPAW